MQLQGELQKRGTHVVHYKNILHAAVQIVKHDGVVALQAGLVPALWVQFIMNCSRLGILLYYFIVIWLLLDCVFRWLPVSR